MCIIKSHYVKIVESKKEKRKDNIIVNRDYYSDN